MANDTRAHLREKALIAAQRILSEEGLSGVQARRVAEAAGCSVGTLYNLYPRLDDLVIAVNAATLSRLGEQVHAAMRAQLAREPEAVLEAMALAYLDFAQANRACWQAVFQHGLSEGQVVPDWYRAHQNDLFAMVEEILAPQITDPDECRMASRTLFGAVHGVVSLALDEKLGAFDPAPVRDQVAFLISAVVRGLKAGSVEGAAARAAM